MKALVYTDTNEVVYRDEPNPVLQSHRDTKLAYAQLKSGEVKL